MVYKRYTCRWRLYNRNGNSKHFCDFILIINIIENYSNGCSKKKKTDKKSLWLLRIIKVNSIISQAIYSVNRSHHNAIVKCQATNDIGSTEEKTVLNVHCMYLITFDWFLLILKKEIIILQFIFRSSIVYWNTNFSWSWQRR